MQSQSDSVPAASRGTLVRLGLIALISAAVYFLAFVRPYSLFQWAKFPDMSIAKMTNHDVRAGWAYVLAFAVLFALYWLATRLVAGLRGWKAWAVVLGGVLLSSAVLLWLYPTDALDIFDYIIRGRMQAFHAGNPFYQTPHFYSADLLYPYTGWKDATTAYGPLWELIAAGVARVAGDSILVNIIAFKLVNIAAFAGSIAVVAALLRRHAPERALFGVTLFAWNPLVLYVVAGNGHNDSLMLFLILLGFFFLSRGNFTLAALMQVAGALVKFIPALIFPLMLLAGWKRLRTWGERISFLLVTGGASLLLTFVTFYPYYQGGDFLGLIWRGHMFTTSLPTWGVILLRNLRIPNNLGDLLVSRAALILLAAWMGRELLKLWRTEELSSRAKRSAVERSAEPTPPAAASADVSTPLRFPARSAVLDMTIGQSPQSDWALYAHAALSILLFYLLVSCLWFQPWYVIWTIGLAALLPEDGLTRGAVFLSMMSNWKMVIFDYVIVHGGPLPNFLIREWPLTTLTLGPSWAFFLYQWRALLEWPRRLVERRRPAPASAQLATEVERET